MGTIISTVGVLVILARPSQIRAITVVAVRKEIKISSVIPWTSRYTAHTREAPRELISTLYPWTLKKTENPRLATKTTASCSTSSIFPSLMLKYGKGRHKAQGNGRCLKQRSGKAQKPRDQILVDHIPDSRGKARARDQQHDVSHGDPVIAVADAEAHQQIDQKSRKESVQEIDRQVLDPRRLSGIEDITDKGAHQGCRHKVVRPSIIRSSSSGFGGS